MIKLNRVAILICLILASNSLVAKGSYKDIQLFVPQVLLDLKYSTEDNFLKRDLYGDFNQCFMHTIAAEKLKKAQNILETLKPGYRLKIFDGLRPRSIQQQMWDKVEGTDQQKYVANPKTGSIHNYGFAVDLTIVNKNNKELDMGTEFDHFYSSAQPRYEINLLRKNKLTFVQLENRLLLRFVMVQAGFYPISNEWWHFDALPKSVVKSTYSIVESVDQMKSL